MQEEERRRRRAETDEGGEEEDAGGGEAAAARIGAGMLADIDQMVSFVAGRGRGAAAKIEAAAQKRCRSSTVQWLFPRPVTDLPSTFHWPFL